MQSFDLLHKMYLDHIDEEEPFFDDKCGSGYSFPIPDSAVKKNKKPSFFMVLEGNIGAGKTTAMELMKEAIMNNEFHAPKIHTLKKEPIEKYTHFGCIFNPLRSMYENPDQNTPISQLHIMRESQKYFSSNLETQSQNILAERSFLSTLPFLETYKRLNKITPFTFAFLREEWIKLGKDTCFPDVIIHLQASPDLCLERIKKRNRAGEEAVSRDFLIALDAAITVSIKYFEQITGARVIRLPIDKNTTRENFKSHLITAIQCAYTYILIREIGEIVAESHCAPPQLSSIEAKNKRYLHLVSKVK